MVRGRIHGIARYALELARRLPLLAPDWEFIGLTGPEGSLEVDDALRPSLQLHRCPANYLSIAEQPALLISLLRTSGDLFHATSFSVPLLWRGALVVTLHDANHLALPENYGIDRAAYYRMVVIPRVRTAKAVLTVSEFSRDELAKHLGLRPSRIEIACPGVDERYRPASPGKVEAFRKARGLPGAYFAAVGNVKAHKNLAVLAPVAAELPAPLVLLAGTGAKRKLGFPSSTVEIQALPEEQMPLFYAGATALLLPSRSEGFGLPALEAMACGCPVIASDAGALPEIAGPAALLVSPGIPAHWRDAATRVWSDRHLAQELIEHGFSRAAGFTWEACAKQVLAAYRRAL